MRPDPSALARLLDEERRLILSADWPGLQALAPRKASLLDSLRPSEGLAPVAAALVRNQALLAAALEGLRDALRRRAAMAAARRGFVTYGATGLRAELSVAPPRVERKA